jgi:hypothetical protein
MRKRQNNRRGPSRKLGVRPSAKIIEPFAIRAARRLRRGGDPHDEVGALGLYQQLGRRVGAFVSTLADLLLYEHLEKEYQAVLIQRDIEEGERLFQTGVTQIFYFDDFMGATFFGDRPGDRPGVLTGTNDRALLNFIAMVRKSPTSRLILTTREHIYAQALDRSERLRHADLNDLRVGCGQLLM